MLPTMGLTTAGEPGPRSIKLSSVTSLSTCQDMRMTVRSAFGLSSSYPDTDLHTLIRKGINAVQQMEGGSFYLPEGYMANLGYQ